MVVRTVTARKLRRDQTDAERTLWFRLRDRRFGELKFRRQVPIDRYIVNFCCESARLIIEVDGGQHVERSEKDKTRTGVLEARGYLLLRFWNDEVLQNTDGVLEVIASTARPVPPHPNPLPAGE